MQPLEVAHQYFDAWNRHDADGIVATFSETGSYTDPTTGGPLHGKAIGAYAAGLWNSFPDLRFELVSAGQASEDVVAAQWVMLGTNDGSMFGLPPTGKAIELPGADFVTVRDGKVESVVGYFDSGLLPPQLGMQILVQPHAVGPFSFGRAVTVHGQRPNRPGAFSVTMLNCADPAEQEKVANYSRQIATEMLGMPGFLGWTGLTCGGRMVTITAWERPEQASQVLRSGSHPDAMKEFFSDNGLAAGGWTAVWQPEHIGAFWMRCGECGRMVNHERRDGVCECGATLPPLGTWW